MPIGRIRTDAPTSKVRTTDTPRSYAKFSAVLIPGTDAVIEAGSAIGLLLALTYSEDIPISTPATFKGIAPISRIRNTD